MLTVLHLLESFSTGGAEKIVLDLCRGLDKRHFRSKALAFLSGDLRDEFNALSDAQVLAKRKGPDPLLLYRLCGAIRTMGVDLVHAVNGLTVVNYGLAAARLTGVPAVAAVHGVSHFEQRGIGPVMWRRMLRSAAATVAVSQDIRDRAQRWVGDGSVELIYNGIEEYRVGCASFSRSRFFLELGIPGDAFVAVFVANLREVKGHVFLFEALARLAPAHPRLHLVLIGKGPLEGELRAVASRLDLAGKVHFAGLRNDVADCLTVADLFVLSSLSEGTPLCLIEAMRAGLPVVASRVGGVPEMVEDGVTGSLVEAANSGLLAGAMDRLIRDRDFAAACGAQGRKRFEERFSQERFLRRYAELFTRAARVR